jgi:peptidoglycan/xylan/chitin deacetylase (PgdA/CDA1 family)/rhodanese-related sulfurtransferase
MKTITPLELQRLIDKGDVELIDVRPKRDFEKVHALVARSIPLSQFEPHSVLTHRKLDRHAPLYLMCRDNTLASLAACGLAGAGLDEPIVVEGGLEAWQRQCLPVVCKKFWKLPPVALEALAWSSRWIHRRITSSNPEAPAPAKAPQEILRIMRLHYFPRVTAVVTVALATGLLVIPGKIALSGDRFDSAKPRPFLAVSGPAKLAKTAIEIERGPRGKSQIALTFDAGANAECFEDLIVALERARVHSTFFITGNWAQRNVDCARAITKHGHEVGNHTWNHLALTKYSDEIVREEITRAEDLLREISGQNPRPRWRAPVGERNDRVLQIAASLGYRSIYWTIDSLDSVEPRKTPEFLIDRITSKTDAELDGAIILMHVGIKSTADALPAIIANLQARGFRLVTVSTLLEPGANRR